MLTVRHSPPPKMFLCEKSTSPPHPSVYWDFVTPYSRLRCSASSTTICNCTVPSGIRSGATFRNCLNSPDCMIRFQVYVFQRNDLPGDNPMADAMRLGFVFPADAIGTKVVLRSDFLIFDSLGSVSRYCFNVKREPSLGSITISRQHVIEIGCFDDTGSSIANSAVRFSTCTETPIMLCKTNPLVSYHCLSELATSCTASV
mmetsp:Transcript_3089/g.4575  ORF Transcript_3089/g.4575 Transcript_3089/m.4575 type:complete len:201 (-) Transcript_3089:555-1157(-)